MDRVFIRSAAISFAFASGAMVVGPGVVGIAESHAILGIGPDIDIFDLFGEDDDKSAMHHPRPGSEEFSAQAARTVGITTADAGPPVSTFGSVPESAGRVAGGGGVPESGGGRRWRCRATLSQGGHRTAARAVRPDHPQHRYPRGTAGSESCRRARAGVRAACVRREPAASRWSRRLRARRCPKAGLRLPGHRHPRLRP